MSQFFIALGAKPVFEDIQNVSLKNPSDDQALIKKAIKAIFQEYDENEYWYFEDAVERTTDAVFSEAQKALNNNQSFEETRLYRLLTKAIANNNHLVLWYGDEWEELPIFNLKKAFLEDVKRQLSEGFGEVYVRFCRKSSS